MHVEPDFKGVRYSMIVYKKRKQNRKILPNRFTIVYKKTPFPILYLWFRNAFLVYDAMTKAKRAMRTNMPYFICLK